MQTTEFTWKSPDGLEMYGRQWLPETPPKASIALVHGLGEHTSRYDHVATALTDGGYAILGFDLRGHGRSGGTRGHAPTYAALMDDITAFFNQVEKRLPGLPRFLYGHSLGGNLVLNHALRCHPNVRGVIATGPWLELAFQPPAAQVRLARFMDHLAPAFSQNSGLKTEGLSHEEAVVTAYEHDPLVHDKISVRLFTSLYDSGVWALDHAVEFPLPLLLMHGAEDPITSAAGSRVFAERAGDKVTLKIWDGLYHEIHNEACQAEVFLFMRNWLDQH